MQEVKKKKHNKKFRFTMTTNGLLLTDDVIEYLNKEMYNVVLSLDGRKELMICCVYMQTEAVAMMRLYQNTKS